MTVVVPPLLAVENLSVGFSSDSGVVPVVEDVSIALHAGRTLGLVGESGSGKSVTAQTIMRLLPTPPAVISGGRVMFEGRDLLAIAERDIRALRGDRLAMVFQEPMTSLNPTMTAGAQIGESLRLHRHLGHVEARAKAIDLLLEVGVGSPERRVLQYPHELSGGLRQRVMIAIALACRPAVLIADEPTTALDVTVQAQVLELLRRLQRDLGLAMLLITHDLGVVHDMCDAVAVMYAGRVVEMGATAEVLGRPRHPYTAALLASSPRLARRDTPLATIAGMVPAPGKRGVACSFVDRCARMEPRCGTVRPPLASWEGGRTVACWNPVT